MTSTPFALMAATLYGTPPPSPWPTSGACGQCVRPTPCPRHAAPRPSAPDGFDLALVSTDLAATTQLLVCRYATCWPIEVCFRDVRQDAGVGQARNRTQRAVQRTVPFGLVCFSLAVVWYAACGHLPGDLAARRSRSPW
jgi:hypothetical protein